MSAVLRPVLLTIALAVVGGFGATVDSAAPVDQTARGAGREVFTP